MQVDYRLLSEIDIRRKNILNIGSGFPVDELQFASRIGSWVSIDISLETIKKAKGVCSYELPHHLSGKIFLVETDATKLPFRDETFDIVTSFSTIDHIPGNNKRSFVCNEIFRVTKKGGYAVVTVPNKYSIVYFIRSKRQQRGGASFQHCFTPNELKKLLEHAGFKVADFASTTTGRTGARGPILKPVLGAIEKHVVQYFGRRMGYLCCKPS